MKGVILAGGEGTRLRPITHTGPKQLVPVANEPVVAYAVEDLVEAGVTDIAVVLGDKGRSELQTFLGDGSAFGAEVTYVVQGRPRGLAHAVGCTRAFVDDDDFVVYLGDNILKQGITDLVSAFERREPAASIALQSVEDPRQFGVADVGDDGSVRRLVEKPEEPPSDLALVGIYVFSPAVFEQLGRLEPSDRGEYEITDAIQLLIDDGRDVDAHVVDGWWKDTGKPEDVLAANRLLLEDHPGRLAGAVADGAEVSGHVDLHETARIDDGAVVRGPVSIDARSTVGAGAYVGPYTSLGPGSTVRNAHVENSVVVGESTIDADGRIVDSLIGRGTDVRSAADQLPDGNRFVLGANSEVRL